MSSIDVSAEIDIAAAPADIASVMFDPQREPEWMKAVAEVEIIDPALAPGAKVRHRGSFVGREVSWMTEVAEVHFPHVLTLRLSEGPFAGTVRYDIQRVGGGSRARVRLAGDAEQLSFVPSAMIEGPVRSALAADLERLKALVEQ
jgi:uncharacterized membrane protein